MQDVVSSPRMSTGLDLRPLLSWWSVYRSTFFRIWIVGVGLLGLLKLGSEFFRLLWETAPTCLFSQEVVSGAILFLGGQTAG